MATRARVTAKSQAKLLHSLESAFIGSKKRRSDYSEYATDPVGFIEIELGEKLTDAQKAIALSVRDNRETNVQAAHGVGKCVASHDKILLSSGLEVEAHTLVGKSFELLTLVEGQVRAVKAIADWNMKEAVCEITTESGRRIIRNINHPLYAAIKWSRNGSHPIIDVQGWSSVERMQQWMTLPPEYNPSKFTSKEWSVKSDRRSEVVCAVPSEVPIFGDKSMPEHEIKLLAYLIGDGGLTTLTPHFTQAPGKQLDEFFSCVTSIGCVPIARGKYGYAVVNPVHLRYTNETANYRSMALGKENDFSCEEHISTDKLKLVMGHGDNTLYSRLRTINIKPVKFYGKGYISKSQLELYRKYDECLISSRSSKLKGSSKGNAKLALQLLSTFTDSHIIIPPDLKLLEVQKQKAIYNRKILNGMRPGIKRNGIKPNPLTLLLQKHGLMGKGSADKIIPNCVFELNKDQLALFLSRLFSTDGWASVSPSSSREGQFQTEIGFCSVSRVLVEQVQRLLLRFGIQANVYQKPKVNAWVLSIRSSEMQIKFADFIGIFGKESAVKKVVDIAYQKQSSKQVPTWRTKNAPPGTIWEKVVSIRRLDDKQMTVAIEVPEHHTYLTSFYEHNSFLSSRLALYWIYCVGGMVITTAPTARQVNQIIWGEIRRAYCKLSLPGDLGKTFLVLTEDARGFGFTAGDSNGFQGIHKDKLLVIQDEACGISDEIDEGASSCATGENNRILRIGNPIVTDNPFERACARRHIRIPVWEHPNVSWAYQQCSDGIYRLKPEVADCILDENAEVLPQSKWAFDYAGDRIPGAVSIAWIEDARRKHGEGSAFWASRVEGFFPSDSEASIIPRSWFKAARSRYDENPKYWDGLAQVHKSRFGLDVGDGGDDHGLARWRGVVLYSVAVQATKGDRQDVTRAAGWAKGQSSVHENGTISVDSIGVGSGTLAILKEQGISASGVNWGGAAKNSSQFANCKAEDFWLLREAFRLGEIAIAPLGEIEDMVMADLSGTYYEETSTGKIKIEDKKLTRKRLHRSPNAGDAVVYGFRKAITFMPDSLGLTRRR